MYVLYKDLNKSQIKNVWNWIEPSPESLQRSHVIKVWCKKKWIIYLIILALIFTQTLNNLHLNNCKFSQLSKEVHYRNVALLCEKPQWFHWSYSEIEIFQFKINLKNFNILSFMFMGISHTKSLCKIILHTTFDI